MNAETKDKTDAGDFIIVADAETQELAKKVNGKLDEGYELYGTPFVFKDAACQAMTFGKVSEK